MNKEMRRRDFLQKAALFTAGLFTLSEITLANNPASGLAYNQKPLLNPAFRMKALDNGELELYTHLNDRSKLSELFAGLDADIIREIVNGNNPLESAEKLAFRHNLSGKECRKKTENLLGALHQSGIVYYGDMMLVKIQEA
jgi:hypothetical protein